MNTTGLAKHYHALSAAERLALMMGAGRGETRSSTHASRTPRRG